MLLERFPLGPLWTNGYLVWDDQGKGFFVDPGGDPREVLVEIDRKSIDLEFILLTHGHADHIGGLGLIRTRARQGVMVHEDDAMMLSRPESNLSAFVGNDIELAPAEKLLRDGDVVRAGRLTVMVIHTPGHTMGSSCFLVGEEGMTRSSSPGTHSSQGAWAGRTSPVVTRGCFWPRWKNCRRSPMKRGCSLGTGRRRP